MNHSFRKSFLTAGLLTAVAACSSDSASSPKALIGPDGAACSQSNVSANGSAVTGTVSASACKLWNVWNNDSTRSASSAIGVQAGKLYSVTSTATGTTGTNVWLGNSLVGNTTADTESTVAISGGNSNTTPLNNVLWFYAQASGTYSLRTWLSDTAQTGYTYTTQVVTCPIVATVAASDTDYVDTSSVGTSGCKQQYTFFSNDSSYVTYYLVQFDAGQTRFFNVQASAFSAGFEVGGPGFDSMWDLDGSNGTSGISNGEYRGLTADSAGTYTLAVGSTTYGGSGAYVLSVVSESLLPTQRVPQPPLGSQSVHLRASQRLHIAH
jgi:hypothetical protein